MENEIQQKFIEWPTIVEYFTKRGRPLTKEELSRLIEADRAEKEQLNQKRRVEEEQERRRMERLMEDLEDKQDFEDFESRQRHEQAEATMKMGMNSRETEEDRYEDEHDFYEDEYMERDMQGGYMSDPELRTAKRTV